MSEAQQLDRSTVLEQRKARKEQKLQAKKEKIKSSSGKDERKERFQNNTNIKFSKMLEEPQQFNQSITPPTASEFYRVINFEELYKTTFWKDPWFKKN